MRVFLALTAVLVALVLPAMAQDAVATKTKTPPPRTYIDSVDRSTSQAVIHGFVEAYAAEDYFRAWLLLSPDAKIDFSAAIGDFNEPKLFPGMAAGTGVTGPTSGALGEDLLTEILMERGQVFDRIMVQARDADLLPFELKPGAFFSPTFERDDQARYTVAAGEDPAVVIISTVKVSDGSWRVERVVWAASDPEARPWGFK